ncbi:MAG: hypothetical protein ACOX1P_03015 [Thermoguttaceae bacterium]|jgi:hypothetical protein
MSWGMAQGWTSRPSWRKWPVEGKERLDAQVVDDETRDVVRRVLDENDVRLFSLPELPALIEEIRTTGLRFNTV